MGKILCMCCEHKLIALWTTLSTWSVYTVDDTIVPVGPNSFRVRLLSQMQQLLDFLIARSNAFGFALVGKPKT
jgi:hypothetical protein